MIRMRHLKILVATVGLAASSVSCGDVVRDGRAPMFLVIDSLQGLRGGPTGTLGNPLISDVLTVMTSPAPCAVDNPCATYFNDTGEVVLRLTAKDLGNTAFPTVPSTNNEVTITRFRVVYRRADGRNTAGVDVPYPFDGAVTGTIQIGSQLTLGFELVRHSAKQEAPLAGLIFSPTIVTTIAEVTFYGRDRVGNDISATGSIQIDFGNFGDF